MRRPRTSPIVLVAALAALLTPAGCGRSEPAPTYPAGAVRLRQNVPTPVGDRRLFAVNITDDRGIVGVEPPGGTAVNVPVTEGKRFTAGGLTFDVLDVVPPAGGGAAPGAGTGAIVILVVAG
jgi:hypothetical protein